MLGTVLVGIPSRIQVLYSARNLLGHYPAVTGAPARFILRIGWANGRHRAGVPCDCTGNFSTLFFIWNRLWAQIAKSKPEAFLQIYFFDLGRPLRDLGPSTNFSEMKRMQGQKPLSSPGARHEYLSAT